MINGIRIKVCGLTSLVDADSADRCGADFIGFNFFPQSPRYLSPDNYGAFSSRLPDRRRVAILVEPTDAQLGSLQKHGFAAYQVHFRLDRPIDQVQAWSNRVGRERLWLAPRIAPGQELNEAWLELADHFLIDAFHPDAFGGTGRTANWEKFRECRKSYPKTNWILAGGLGPENVGAALQASGARFLDVNSGIESSPGVKDPARMAAFFAAVRAATGG